MPNTFTAKCILGLGITSVIDFVRLMSKYKAIRDLGIEYVTSNTYAITKGKQLVIFDSVRELFRMHEMIKPNMVVVISDTPVILKEIPDLIPLDYSTERSFEFNFLEIDPHKVMRHMRGKETVTSRFVNFDNLGYHVNRVRGGGELINAYLAITSSMPYDIRSKLREATVKFFMAKKANVATITDCLDVIGKKYAFTDDVTKFKASLTKHYKDYYDAVNSGDAAAQAAKKFNIDAYAVSYFRKLLNQKSVNDERLRKNNVRFKPKIASVG